MFLIKYKQWKYFVENNVMQQQHAGDDVHLKKRPTLQYSFFLQGISQNNIIFIVYIS